MNTKPRNKTIRLAKRFLNGEITETQFSYLVATDDITVSEFEAAIRHIERRQIYGMIFRFMIQVIIFYTMIQLLS